ncbi:MAG: Sulfatase, partial [Verrucomicrobiales bacterium]|nr:Sulfatase [Verrucomicrobiales bacterium]
MPVPVKPTMFNNNGNIMGSPWEAKPRGQSGIMMTDLFPHLAELADDLAIIRSMTSPVNEHAQGNYFFHTGFASMGHPSAGAWVGYGLGSVNQNLPGFVVLQSGGAVPPHGGVGLYSNGFLPSQYQASLLKVDANPALANIRPSESDRLQRKRLAFIHQFDETFAQTAGEMQIEGAIKNYETAYRMQTAVPELCDITGETEATKKLYGLDSPVKEKAAYARQCLVARRLVERGVRFVELSCLTQNIGAGGAPNPWDQHGQIKEGHGAMAFQVDQPIAGLIRDLKSRGILDETLILFSGEFGRTPFSQGSDGRDHNPFGFSLWM